MYTRVTLWGELRSASEIAPSHLDTNDAHRRRNLRSPARMLRPGNPGQYRRPRPRLRRHPRRQHGHGSDDAHGPGMLDGHDDGNRDRGQAPRDARLRTRERRNRLGAAMDAPSDERGSAQATQDRRLTSNLTLSQKAIRIKFRVCEGAQLGV